MKSEYMHRIWLGGQMPERYAHYGELWRELNPGRILWDWSEEEIMDTSWHNDEVLRDLYHQSRQPGADMIAYYTHVADVVDYEILWRYGGWYFNTDIKPIRPLSTLEYDKNFPALAMEDDVHIVNMAMYGPANAAFYAKVIELLPKRYFGMPGAYMNATTGVQLLMESRQQFQGQVTAFPRQVFNPIHWADFAYGDIPDLEREYPPETVAIHEWLHRTNRRGQRVLES